MTVDVAVATPALPRSTSLSESRSERQPDVHEELQPLVLDDELRKQLNGLQLTSILQHASVAAAVSTIFAITLAMYLSPTFGAVNVHLWLGAKIATALPRFALAQAYRHKRWRLAMRYADVLTVISIALDGVVWGAAGVAGVGGETSMACLMVACLSSVAAVATLGLQVRLRTTASFVIPVMIPTAIALAMRNDTFGFFGAGGVALILAQMLVTGYTSEQRVKREFLSRQESARALRTRSEALQQLSRTSAELEETVAQLKRQTAAKALFLGTMSHELRTPLHGILGVTELLRRKASDPEAKKQLDLVEGSGQHLLELINALLDVSRMDAGRLELHSAPFDLRSELQKLADLYELRARDKGLAFRATLGSESPLWVHGDAARIRQVLHNLLGNAVKFTKHGLVRLTAVEATDHAGTFTFEVADTGPGIRPQDLPHIFEAFRQAEDVAARPSDGTGLGLTIARELAVAMHGDITARSAEGVGSSFTFTALLSRCEHLEVPKNPEQDLQVPPQNHIGGHVLLAEDNDVNAMIATAHLERMGVRTTRAMDGREAVQLALTADRPQLIFMDCHMPDMDGATATREIRLVEETTGTRRVPIVALTATTTDEDREKCFAAGMDDFLMKPFTYEQLSKIVSTYLDENDADDLCDDPEPRGFLTLH